MEAVLHVQERSKSSRGSNNSLRRKGNIPGVIYGKDVHTTPISVERADFKKQLGKIGKNGMFSLNVGGKTQKAIVRSYEVDPLSREIIHVDFFVVDPSTVITSDVRVVLVNDAEGVKDGGVLQQAIHELSISTSANQMPDTIEVDVKNLKVGETITVGDIKQQHSLDINHEDEQVIASILPPKQEEEISTGEEQEPGIPDNLEGREE